MARTELLRGSQKDERVRVSLSWLVWSVRIKRMRLLRMLLSRWIPREFATPALGRKGRLLRPVALANSRESL